MRTHKRSGHFRTNADGTRFWVRTHSVSRAASEHEAIARTLFQSDASNILKRFSAHSLISCIINPNAKCPVCGKAVFYYSNERGSRVYFDTLGPPWPKHPCTDNPIRPLAGPFPVFKEPQRRPNGLIEELLQAARTVAGDLHQYQDNGWRIFRVTETKKIGNRHIVIAESLITKPPQSISVSYVQDHRIISINEFIFVNGIFVSFLHRETFMPMSFRNGEALLKTLNDPNTSNFDARLSHDNYIANNASITLIKQTKLPDSKPIERHKARANNITYEETVHFKPMKMTTQKFLDKLTQRVQSYKKRGIHKSSEITNQLNADGLRTADGSLWTPRLTALLLSFLVVGPTLASKIIANEASKFAIKTRGKTQSKTQF